MRPFWKFNIRDTEKTEGYNFVEHNIFYFHTTLVFLIGLTIKSQTIFENTFLW